MELQDELMTLWEAKKRTVLMVTHDVDEALHVADRIVMMTSGPAATIGQVLEIPFPPPAPPRGDAARPDYFWLRDSILNFLEECASHPNASRHSPGGKTPATHINDGNRRRGHRTLCPYRGVGRGLLVKVTDGMVSRVRGDPEHPANFGDVCAKAIHLPPVLPHRGPVALSPAPPAPRRRARACVVAGGPRRHGRADA